MNNELTFSFIGGDLRQLRVMISLASDGYKVKALGFDAHDTIKNDKIYTALSLEDVLENSDIIVLPLPYSTGDESINSPLSSQKIYISDVLKKMKSEQILFVGKADERLEILAKLYNVHVIDYMKREELAILNAIPTAEGAILTAMQETPFTIHNSRCLVIGNGRIGKVLAQSLKGLGANVSVVARKYSDIAWIKSCGNIGVPFKNLSSCIGESQIIFNTVPAMILDFKILSKVSKDSIIIDLASRPGGVDFETARELGKKVVWALSLPGKVAPDTAGDIIKDTIINILEELGQIEEV
ncbi:MAG: dipicolinate synthase subunit DpsA [Oscillospiraceae bacterium]